MTGGRVVLVGTPIGNLGDLSPRAAAALAAADVICCEDTRRTRKLLSASGVPAPRLVVMHQHNEAASAAYAVELAAGGAIVAVVTDAGMPGISDPGERVVRLAAAEDIPVEVVPGPSALVTALVASGLPAARFCFEGFLPRRGRERDTRLARVAARDCTSVIYEAPHRVVRTLADLSAVCGPDRQVAAGRELTKVHEELWRGTLGEARAWAEAGEPRGEWVLVVAGADISTAAPATDADVVDALRARLDAGADRRQAVAAVAADLHLPKRSVYQLAVGLDGEGRGGGGRGARPG
ncbi:MAG TPA: 16S rRNA (cytidine(1402)-2'-O)-methyltransferase [Acidimicrobiales bacterium]